MRATGENEVKFAREAGVFHHLTKYQGEQDDLEVEKMLQISRRAAQIAPSATLAIDTRAKALKAEGKDVVGFGAGEPDFDTPEYVRAAAHRAIDEGRTRYTPVPGTLSLRKTIADHRLQRRQEVALHGVERARQRRRRGAHPLALLGQLPGNGENGGRRAGICALPP